MAAHSSIILPQPLLTKEKDRVIRKPLFMWANELNQSFNSFAPHNGRPSKSVIEKFSVITNQFCLILFYMNAITYSEKMCSFLIDILRRCYQKYGDIFYVEFLMQPLINLARLYSFNKQFSKSTAIYRKIERLKKGTFSLNNKKILLSELSSKTQAVLQYVGFYEPIKMYALNNKFSELEVYTKSLEEHKEFLALWYECSILIFLYRGELEIALELCDGASQTLPYESHLFYLKRAHLYRACGNEEKSSRILNSLISPYLAGMPKLNYQGLTFCYDLVKSIYPLPSVANKNLMDFLFYVYEQSKEFEDEVLQLECLKLLQKFDAKYIKDFEEKTSSSKYYLLFKKQYQPFQLITDLSLKIKTFSSSLVGHHAKTFALS